MVGYVVTTRVKHARLRGGPATWLGSGDRPADTPTLHDRPVVEDLVGRPLDVALGETWSDIRRHWAHTTFYLFDPDSWR